MVTFPRLIPADGEPRSSKQLDWTNIRTTEMIGKHFAVRIKRFVWSHWLMFCKVPKFSLIFEVSCIFVMAWCHSAQFIVYLYLIIKYLRHLETSLQKMMPTHINLGQNQSVKNGVKGRLSLRTNKTVTTWYLFFSVIPRVCSPVI